MSYVIRDLLKSDEFEFCHCLESWSEEMSESGDHKERWTARMKDKGLGVKIAVTDDMKYAGMIQYYPAEFSPVTASTDKAWFIHCIWVHGYKKGQGNFQGRGIGKALLEAAEYDIRQHGGKAAVAWGLTIPVWMKSRWYRKQGYIACDRTGMQELVIRSLNGEVHQAKWRKVEKTPLPVDDDGNLQITSFISGACTATAIAFERIRKAAENFSVPVRLIDSSDPTVLKEWGLFDTMFVGSKKVALGPPPSTARLQRIIKRELRRNYSGTVSNL